LTETPLADNPGGAEEAKRGAGLLRPKHAASLILWRDGPAGVEVLMGLRHARHRFMPNMLVFPGGRVDRADHRAPVISELTALARTSLERQAPPSLARAIGVAAARELEEETGLVLGRMEGTRLHADLAPLEYLCRAVTPPNRVARFNARFLIAPADAAHGALRGSGELEEAVAQTVVLKRGRPKLCVSLQKGNAVIFRAYPGCQPPREDPEALSAVLV
jgi:8-oxo-dGTP pyrophosphatase MutT (NUDIX family)